MRVKMKLRALSISIVAIAFAWFLSLGATVTDAIVWSSICVVYASVTAALDKITGKSANPRSELYGVVYFAVAIGTTLSIHFFLPDESFTLTLVLFFSGLFVAQFLAQIIYGLPAEKNLT